MCTLGGAVAANNKELDISLISSILEGLDLRGRDAFSAYLWFKDNRTQKITTHSKQQLADQVKVHLSNLKGLSLTGRAIPASERVHPEGIDLNRDSQPFEHNGIIVAHNGTLSNDNELKQVYDINPESSVDTAILPYMFNKEKDVNKVIDDLKGSFALSVMFTKDNLLALTTNFMPLYAFYNNDVMYWASDPVQLPMGTQLKYYGTLLWNMNTGKLLVERHRNNLNMDKVFVVCSGGMDSITTARLYQVLGLDVTMVHFKYGQAAQSPEDWSSSEVEKLLGIPKMTIDVKSLFENTKPSVLLGGVQIDISKYRHLDMESTTSYVGARNLIFSSITMAIAEKFGAGRIALGLNLDDSVYPDNNITFLRELTNVSSLSLDWNSFQHIAAPFVNMTKKELLEIAIAIGSPLHLHASCYYPEVKDDQLVFCGECGCCKLREYSFKGLGIIDPIPYKVKPDWGNCKPLDEVYPDYKSKLVSSLKLTPEEIPYMKYLYM